MKHYIKLHENVYNELANEYKERLKYSVVSDKEIAQPFIEYLKKKFKEQRVLELGPGSGLT